MKYAAAQSEGVSRVLRFNPAPRGISGAVGKPRVLIIADDLTGACDSGIAFVKAGLSVSVRLNPLEADVAPAEVIALSTETRNLDRVAAESYLLRLEGLSRYSDSLLFKKVDSAGRGHPVAEILTVSQLFKPDAVVYAPAFPIAGRTLLNGILRIQDASGQDMELNLLSVVPDSAKHRVSLIPRLDAQALRHALLHAHAAGKDIWLCDSQTQSDLQQIADAARTLPLRLLWAGSAGLAEAVAAPMKTASHPAPPNLAARAAQGSTLLCWGTAHPVTALQLDCLACQAQAIDSELGLPPSGCGVLQIVRETISEESFRMLWRQLHLPGRPAVNSLVLTGGDTAAFVLKALGATSLQLGGEVEPGIPWGIVETGLAQGCVVVTKSGGFGNAHSLKHAAEFCKRLCS